MNTDLKTPLTKNRYRHKGAMRLKFCVRQQPVRQSQTSTPGTTRPTLRDKCMSSLTPPASYVTLKVQETRPTIYSRYPSKSELLTICTVLSYFKTLTLIS